MSDEKELAEVVERVIDGYHDIKDIDPAWVATHAMTVIEFPRALHRLGYAGCHLELRQIARGKLRKRFDPTAAADDDEQDIDDLFPETLQERYPKARKKGEQPTYRRLWDLQEEDVIYNASRMEKVSDGLARHADRLRNWWRERSATA